MWSLLQSNRKCFEKNKETVQYLHLEQVLFSKPSIRNQEPFKPSFLSKRNPLHSTFEEKFSAKNNNDYMSKMLGNIIDKCSSYHPSKLKLKECPAYQEQGYNKKYEQLQVQSTNDRMKTRIKSAQTKYSNKVFTKEFERKEYFKKLISRKKEIKTHTKKLLSPAELLSTFKKFKINQKQFQPRECNSNPFLSKMLTKYKVFETKTQELQSNSRRSNAERVLTANTSLSNQNPFIFNTDY